MSIFHPLCNAPADEYVKDLEDEVMTLRAKLQAMTNERDVWKKRADEMMEILDSYRYRLDDACN